MDKTLICQECGTETHRNGAMQKYCEPCSAVRNRLRQARWAAKHPRKPAARIRAAEVASEVHERTKDAGIAASSEAAHGIFWDGTSGPDFLWFNRVAFPFTYNLSKNRIYHSHHAGGHVAIRREVRAAREQIAMTIRASLLNSGRRVANNKLWIELLVQKPDHKGDAINILDTVADAIKVGVGLDDRWFCISRLDWQIVKENPRVFIGFGQDTTEDCSICSSCGGMKPLDAFGRRKGQPLGVARVCLECRSEGRRLARLRKGSGGGTGA